MTQQAETTQRDSGTRAVTRYDAIQRKVTASRAEFTKALGRHGIQPEFFERTVLTALRRDPKLLECEPVSLMSAFMTCAQLGLVPDSVAGDAYPIPYFNTKKRQYECQLMPGYRGFIRLAYRGGHVTKIVAHTVREGDEFTYQFGTEEYVRHVPRFDESREITHVYAMAWQKEGPPVFVVLPRSRVDTIRERSKERNRGKESPAWAGDYEAMAHKTAVRSLYRWLRVEPEAQRAANVDERFDMDPGFDSAREAEVEVVGSEDPTTVMERRLAGNAENPEPDEPPSDHESNGDADAGGAEEDPFFSQAGG